MWGGGGCTDPAAPRGTVRRAAAAPSLARPETPRSPIPPPARDQAGGLGSTGLRRVLDIVPEKVHQREPLFCGSKGEVELLEAYLQGKRS